jgi:hypothetical protein
MSYDFDGHYETVRLENGERFGIAWNIYQCLAQAAISVSELAQIEPILMERLLVKDDSGKRFVSGGAVCTLYGRTLCFKLVIETHFPEPIVTLTAAGLDNARGSESVIVHGDAEASSVWRRILAAMLAAEGFQGMSLDELDSWNREHGLAS